MERFIKIMFTVLGFASLAYLFVAPPTPGQAAPNVLPACGHGAISTTLNRAVDPPDIAFSDNQFYTAVVWAQGTDSISSRGDILLAYSDALTSTRTWSYITVENSFASRSPTIAFDPTNNKIVHVAYQVNYNSGEAIFYRRCELDGTCDAPQLVSAENSTNPEAESTQPQIAVIDDGTPVVIYQFKENANSSTTSIKYSFLNGNTWGNGIELSSEGENPAVAAEEGTVYVVYATSGAIVYVPLTYGSGSFSVGADTDFDVKVLNGDYNPQYPDIGVSNGKIGVVWQVDNDPDAEGGSPPSEYYLVYNRYNGDSWDFSPVFDEYGYLFENSTSTANRQPWFTNQNRDEYIGGLKPSLFMTGLDIHLTWQAKATDDPGTTHDIYYSKLTGSGWEKAAPEVYANTLTAGPFVNLTEVYGGKAKVEPAMLFGGPASRLQVVYMTELDSGWGIFYNGWQISDEGAAEPAYQVDDSDCDLLSDDFESQVVSCPNAADPNDCDDDGIPNNSDNDLDNDDIPDIIDDDSDGDGDGDDAETIGGTDPTDPTDSLPKVYLPIVLK